MVYPALLPRLIQSDLGGRRHAFASILFVYIHSHSPIYISLPVEVSLQNPYITLLITSLHHYPAYRKRRDSKTAATMLSESSFGFLASALHIFASLHLASTSVVPAQKFPIMPRQTNSSNTGISLPNTTKKFYANALCNSEQEQVEQAAWNDAFAYAHALASWHANDSYQTAMDMYMGNDSRGPIGDILEGGTTTQHLYDAMQQMLTISSSSEYRRGSQCPYTVYMA